MTDDSKLVAALFDTKSECRRIEFLYRDGQEQFSLISGCHGDLDYCEALDLARAKSWIAQHRDRATVIVDF